MQERMAIEAIQTASKKIFSTMLGRDLVLEATQADTASAASDEGICAQISLVGACSITSLICCSEQVACAIAASMLMQECPGIDAEVLDAMAEIANMIMGYVKTELDAHLGEVNLSIPTVIFGRNFTVRNHVKRWVIVPFRMEEGRFSVKVCFEPAQEGRGQNAPAGLGVNGLAGAAGAQAGDPAR